MNTKWFLRGVLTVTMILSSVTFAQPFALPATHDVTIANDDNMGPDDRLNSTDGLHVRNRFFPGDNPTSRRRVSFVRYDISGLGQTGDKFFDVVLSVRATDKEYAGPVMVWGVKQEFEDFDFQEITWLNAPGVVNNLPLNAPVELDYADLSDMLVTLDPEKNARTASSISTGLAAFLNADTNGVIVLMLAESGLEACNSILRPVEYTTVGSGVADPSGEKFGVVLTGEIGKPVGALDPVPFDDANVSVSLAQVSWTNPEPNLPGGIVSCDVYFGDTEPNVSAPNYGLTVLATGTSATSAALPALQKGKTYYWIVDMHDTTGGMTQGLVWTFNTLNQAPVVASAYAGAWIPGSPSVELALDVTDPDNYPGPLTYLWEQYSAPTGVTVVIDPNDTLTTTVTLPQAGEYVFKLTADDGGAQGVGYVQVFVRDNACAAAKAIPTYSFPTDNTGDCLTNLADLAKLAANWAKCHPYMGQIAATCD